MSIATRQDAAHHESGHASLSSFVLHHANGLYAVSVLVLSQVRGYANVLEKVQTNG